MFNKKHLTKKAQRQYLKSIYSFMEWYRDMVQNQDQGITWTLDLLNDLKNKIRAWEVIKPIAHDIADDLEFYIKIVNKGIQKINKYLENKA